MYVYIMYVCPERLLLFLVIIVMVITVVTVTVTVIDQNLKVIIGSRDHGDHLCVIFNLESRHPW